MMSIQVAVVWWEWNWVHKQFKASPVSQTKFRNYFLVDMDPIYWIFAIILAMIGITDEFNENVSLKSMKTSILFDDDRESFEGNYRTWFIDIQSNNLINRFNSLAKNVMIHYGLYLSIVGFFLIMMLEIIMIRNVRWYRFRIIRH